MAHRHKRRRKEPRRLTPPLILTNTEDSTDRTAILVDEELVLQGAYRSGCMRCYLRLGAGLRVHVGSRCINKKRVAVITIRRADLPAPDPEYPAYREAEHAMRQRCAEAMDCLMARIATPLVDA